MEQRRVQRPQRHSSPSGHSAVHGLRKWDSPSLNLVPREFEEDLVRDMGERRPCATIRRELREQYGRLTHDRIDEQSDVHR